MNTTFLFASLAVSAILAGVFAVAKIKVIERKARAGRNPRTGEPVQVPAKRALKITFLQPGKEALGQ